MNFFTLIQIFLSLSAQSAATEACALEGSGYIEISCEDARKEISISMQGMEAVSMDSVQVRIGSINKSSAEYPFSLQAVFERVDAGVFTYSANLANLSILVMGIPKTFKIKSSPAAHGAKMLKGSFTAIADILGGDFSLHERGSSQVTCRVEILDCPRSPL